MRRVLGLTLVVLGLSASPANADQVVNTLGDAGTGGCTASECTLREAVVASVGANDPVILPAGTYNLTQGPLQLTGDAIVGAGARTTVIDGGGTNKVLHVTGGISEVSGVTLRNGGGVSTVGSALPDGGAVRVETGFAPTTLTMTSVAVTGSHSSGDGGGIANIGSTLTLVNSTVSGNSAVSSMQSFGGGIAAEGAGTTTLRNTTVSNNMASADAPAPGGGIYVVGGGASAIQHLVMDGVTIAGNKSPRASGLYLASSNSTGSITRTIIAGNLLLTGAPGPACELDSGVVTSSLSIADDATCDFAGSPRDPQLGALANNGGPTDTHALAITSPAIDAGGSCTPADQRGVPRQGACDIGAFEFFRPQLTVIKRVINNDGNTQTARDFNVHVRAGSGDVAGSPQPGSATGTTYSGLAPGTYSVAEDKDTTYTTSFSGDCSATGTVTLAESQTATCTITNNDKQPGIRKNVNLEPEGGTVRVKRPGGKFHILREGEQVPVGTIVDARKGRVTLIAAASRTGTATSLFFDGIFKIGQTKGKKPTTVLTLTEKLTGCKATGKKASAAKKKVRKRRLWGDGHGRFQTKGKHSAATVVGTKWLVEDRCTSTLTKVARGKVKVRDFVKKKTVFVKKGHRYIARAK